MRSSFHLKILSSFQPIYLQFVVVKDDEEVDLSAPLHTSFCSILYQKQWEQVQK